MSITPYVTGEVQVAPPSDGRSVVSRIMDRVRTFLSAGGPYSALPGGYFGGYFGGGYGGAFWMGDGALGNLGPVTTEATVMGLPAYGRGVELIASTIAGVELRGYRYDSTLLIDTRIDPAPEVLRDPDPISTPWNWKFAVAEDGINYGNHFARLGDPNAQGWPRWLVPIDATLVSLGVDKATGLLWWKIGKNEVVPYGELFHISFGNRSGKILGRSKIVQYADALGGLLSTDAHARRYFRSGGLPSAVLKSTDPDFTQEQAQQLKDRYRATVGSGSQEPMVIRSDIEFTPVVSDAEKQQLVAARQWDSQLAAMILGIPSTYLGLVGPSMNYTTVETIDIGFVRDTVDRWSKPIEAAVTKWLLPYGTTAKFDWSGRMRTDSKSRAEVLQIEKGAGLLTSDEGRQMLNRPPIAAPAPPPQLTPAQTTPTPEVLT